MNKKIRYSCLFALLFSSTVCIDANADLTTQFQAELVSNSCNITVSNDGQVYVGIVSADYLDAFTPDEYGVGTRFLISVNECGGSSSRPASKIHFSFQPQSGLFYSATRQVFYNDLPVDQGGSPNAGISIFSEQLRQNVLNTSGASDVIYNRSDNPEGDYYFSARLQKAGTGSDIGQVTSHVIVNVYYD